MASISKLPNGRKTIQVYCPDGKRRSIRIGKSSMKDAQLFRVRVESLVSARLTGRSPDDETSRWLSKLPDNMARMLHRYGLADYQPAEKIGPFLDEYFRRRSDVKGSTRTVWGHVRRNLISHFGAERTLESITPADADEWRRSLLSEGLAEPTVNKRCQIARQFFRQAIRKKLILDNPFADVEATNLANRERDFFVTREMAQMVLDACPDDEWRLLFALCRYGGLRCPSEPLALSWEHVDWENSTVNVPSPKTEHHAGGESRRIPLFRELRPHLEAVYRESSGTGPVIVRYRDANSNLRTQLFRIIKRAGLEPWPKLFHNLRATRETELVEDYPLHVACAWIGNSQAVAMKHYLQVRDKHFAEASGRSVGEFPNSNPNRDSKAVQSGVLHLTETRSNKGKEAPDSAPDCGVFPLNSPQFRSLPQCNAGATGLPLISSIPDGYTDCGNGVLVADALLGADPPESLSQAAVLAQLIQAWSVLSDETRMRIVALIEGSVNHLSQPDNNAGFPSHGMETTHGFADQG